MKILLIKLLFILSFFSTIFSKEKIDIGWADQIFDHVNVGVGEVKSYIEQIAKKNPKTARWLKENPKKGIGLLITAIVMARCTYVNTKKFLGYLCKKLKKSEKYVCPCLKYAGYSLATGAALFTLFCMHA